MTEIDAVRGELARAVTVHAEARGALERAVVAARAAGVSWATIGAVAGISRQAAWERWRSLVPPEHAHLVGTWVVVSTTEPVVAGDFDDGVAGDVVRVTVDGVTVRMVSGDEVTVGWSQVESVEVA